MKWALIKSVLLLSAMNITCANANTSLSCPQVQQPPTIDGDPADDSWSRTESVSALDAVADIEHVMRCVHTDEYIYILASFPDTTENRQHKTQIWDEAGSRYRIGPKREDTLIFKWSMESKKVDLSLSSDDSYKADIWYWKSFRTDSQGYADDKHQIYSADPMSRAKKMISRSGRRFYLSRRGDTGRSAYRSMTYASKQDNEVTGYELRRPTGSRADVIAKAQWQSGIWYVEFSRKLITGHQDDVQFVSGRRYQFGVSRYEIAGRVPDAGLESPLFGAGEIGETLELEFVSEVATGQ
ncbi:MAG: ethylbenzene dehydrogenase-related protein [Granulosicoccus sp.]